MVRARSLFLNSLLVWCSVIKLNNISDGFRREGESRWLSRHAASRLERPAAAPPGRTTSLFYGDEKQRCMGSKEAEIVQGNYGTPH